MGKDVPLPGRWLRGFAEVPVVAAGFDARAELAAAEAASFLRRLPAGGDRSVLWVVPAGRTLRLTSRPVPGAACLAGAGRLVALRPLVRFARVLRVYGPVAGPASPPAASTWELDTSALRLSLTLSAEPYRGFSGEGAVPAGEAAGDAAREAAGDAETIAGLLAAESVIDVDALAAAAGISAPRVRAALIHLGTAGRVGYDVAEAAYFHRVLPFDPDRVDRHNPRLAGARALADSGAVTVDDTGGTATVASGEDRYRVRRVDGRLRCTCPWWARYRGARGPCQHALAFDLVTRAVGEQAR